MREISESVITNVIALLQEEATNKIEGISRNIQEMELLQKEENAKFQSKVNKLTELKNNLKK